MGERFQLQSCFLSPIDRHLYANGQAEFLPVGIYHAGVLPPGLDNFNVYLMKVSPPNREGYVSFSEGQIMSRLMARRADLVVGEIDEHAIWSGGDNAIYSLRSTTSCSRARLCRG